MKRKVEEIDTTKLKDDIPELKDSNVKIFIDAENQKHKKEIESALSAAGRKRLNTIIGCILRGVYHKIYKKEKVKV